MAFDLRGFFSRMRGRPAEPGRGQVAEVDPQRHQVADAEPIVAGMQLRDGWNSVHQAAGGLELTARVAGGKVVEWGITENGQPLSTFPQETTTAAGTKTCWECAKDTKGNVHCWKVPCPERAPITTTRMG